MNTPDILRVRSDVERELSFTCNDINDENWTAELVSRINELIIHDFNRLILVLYRLDVSECKLKQLLAQYSNENAAEIISCLIIERQFQKIKSRQEFHRNDDNIDENEKW